MATNDPHPAGGTGCCPRFEPAPWNESEIELDNRLFLADRVHSFLHIPLNFGSVMARNMARIDAASARDAELLVLTDENSLWGADVYVAVAREVPGARTVRISGHFLSKVFEGPFKDIRKWCRQMRDYVAGKGKTIQRLLFYYTTCPRCAKVYGHNYVVLLAEV